MLSATGNQHLQMMSNSKDVGNLLAPIARWYADALIRYTSYNLPYCYTLLAVNHNFKKLFVLYVCVFYFFHYL